MKLKAVFALLAFLVLAVVVVETHPRPASAVPLCVPNCASYTLPPGGAPILQNAGVGKGTPSSLCSANNNVILNAGTYWPRQNDLIVIIPLATTTTTSPFSPPVGFSTEDAGGTVTHFAQWAEYYKIANGNEGLNFVVPSTCVNGSFFYAIYVVSGENPGHPFDVHNTNITAMGATTGPFCTNSVTPTTFPDLPISTLTDGDALENVGSVNPTTMLQPSSAINNASFLQYIFADNSLNTTANSYQGCMTMTTPNGSPLGQLQIEDLIAPQIPISTPGPIQDGIGFAFASTATTPIPTLEQWAGPTDIMPFQTYWNDSVLQGNVPPSNTQLSGDCINYVNLSYPPFTLPTPAANPCLAGTPVETVAATNTKPGPGNIRGDFECGTGWPASCTGGFTIGYEMAQLQSLYDTAASILHNVNNPLTPTGNISLWADMDGPPWGVSLSSCSFTLPTPFPSVNSNMSQLDWPQIDDADIQIQFLMKDNDSTSARYCGASGTLAAYQTWVNAALAIEACIHRGIGGCTNPSAATDIWVHFALNQSSPTTIVDGIQLLENSCVTPCNLAGFYVGYNEPSHTPDGGPTPAGGWNYSDPTDLNSVLCYIKTNGSSCLPPTPNPFPTGSFLWGGGASQAFLSVLVPYVTTSSVFKQTIFNNACAACTTIAGIITHNTIYNAADCINVVNCLVTPTPSLDINTQASITPNPPCLLNYDAESAFTGTSEYSNITTSQASFNSIAHSTNNAACTASHTNPAGPTGNDMAGFNADFATVSSTTGTCTFTLSTAMQQMDWTKIDYAVVQIQNMADVVQADSFNCGIGNYSGWSAAVTVLVGCINQGLNGCIHPNPFALVFPQISFAKTDPTTMINAINSIQNSGAAGVSLAIGAGPWSNNDCAWRVMHGIWPLISPSPEPTVTCSPPPTPVVAAPTLPPEGAYNGCEPDSIMSTCESQDTSMANMGFTREIDYNTIEAHETGPNSLQARFAFDAGIGLSLFVSIKSAVQDPVDPLTGTILKTYGGENPLTLWTDCGANTNQDLINCIATLCNASVGCAGWYIYDEPGCPNQAIGYCQGSIAGSTYSNVQKLATYIATVSSKPIIGVQTTSGVPSAAGGWNSAAGVTQIANLFSCNSQTTCTSFASPYTSLWITSSFTKNTGFDYYPYCDAANGFTPGTQCGSGSQVQSPSDLATFVPYITNTLGTNYAPETLFTTGQAFSWFQEGGAGCTVYSNCQYPTQNEMQFERDNALYYARLGGYPLDYIFWYHWVDISCGHTFTGCNATTNETALQNAAFAPYPTSPPTAIPTTPPPPTPTPSPTPTPNQETYQGVNVFDANNAYTLAITPTNVDVNSSSVIAAQSNAALQPSIGFVSGNAIEAINLATNGTTTFTAGTITSGHHPSLELAGTFGSTPNPNTVPWQSSFFSETCCSDSHAFVVNTNNTFEYEMDTFSFNGTTLTMSAGALWTLNKTLASQYWAAGSARGDAVASGLPEIAGALIADRDCCATHANAATFINHALEFIYPTTGGNCAGSGPCTGDYGYIRPASGDVFTAGDCPGTLLIGGINTPCQNVALYYGDRIFLPANFISGGHAPACVNAGTCAQTESIIYAMMIYGAVYGDQSPSGFGLRFFRKANGATGGWSSTDLANLSSLTIHNFQVYKRAAVICDTRHTGTC